MFDGTVKSEGDEAAMYFQITAKCEETNESSYMRKLADGKEEEVLRIQLSLVVPGMRDRVQCELSPENAPKPEILERWELEEAWVVVSADTMRALAFERSNVRAGEKPVGSLVIFQATDVREATADERKKLQEARKVQKVKAKQQRKARQDEKKAAKEAERAAAQVAQSA